MDSQHCQCSENFGLWFLMCISSCRKSTNVLTLNEINLMEYSESQKSVISVVPTYYLNSEIMYLVSEAVQC